MREIRGAPRVLEVRPPRTAAGEPWLPARRVTLAESWSRDPAALSAGVPVVRTLIVRAEGIAGDRLPRLRMPAPPGLRAHYDQSDFSSEYVDSGVAGQRMQRVVLMPLAEGELELPEVTLSWWDIAADAPRTATLPGRVLRVGAAVAAEPAPEPPPEVSPGTELWGFAVAVLTLCSLVLWAHVRKQRQREALRELRAACRRNNALAARDALIEWWQAATGERVGASGAENGRGVGRGGARATGGARCRALRAARVGRACVLAGRAALAWKERSAARCARSPAAAALQAPGEALVRAAPGESHRAS